MTLRQRCTECGNSFDYQHGDGSEKGGDLMFMVIKGGWDLQTKDRGHIGERWTVDLCSKKCLKKWYRKKFGRNF